MFTGHSADPVILGPFEVDSTITSAAVKIERINGSFTVDGDNVLQLAEGDAIIFSGTAPYVTLELEQMDNRQIFFLCRQGANCSCEWSMSDRGFRIYL